MLDKTKKDWWKSAVFYQVYPKSFQDTDGDGFGDLRGVIGRLDYLEKLGVDGIWLSPVYASPQKDNGYDISDYRGVDPRFGTMEDMEELIARARERGISIIMDLVLNHSSDRHPWFLAAKADRESPCHDYYIWRDGTPDTPPNDMTATFGGPAWTWAPETGQWYFNMFSPWQPDLNWENPALRRELYDMIRFWVDKGVEGFRLDVIDNIGKTPDEKITFNGPHLHEYIRELRREAFREDTLVTVGEAWSADVETAKRYANPDGSELSMIFQFEHTTLDQKSKWEPIPLSLVKLKECYDRWQNGLRGEGWNSLFLNNHDLPRTVSRWGDDGKYRVESAKMLAAMCHGMQGTPYIYQGEELGMTNYPFMGPEDFHDIESVHAYEEWCRSGIVSHEEFWPCITRLSRDNARTPMQWDDGSQAGFTTGTPWMPVNPNYREINARAALADPDSVFYFYQKLISLRKQCPVIVHGEYKLLLADSEELFVYERRLGDERLLTACNFTDRDAEFVMPKEFAKGKCLIANYKEPGEEGKLRPYEAVVMAAGGD